MEELLRRYGSEFGIQLGGDDIAALIKYAELITKWNRITNLVGSGTTAELVKNHIVDCLAAVPFIEGSHIVDVGAGAGLPGIVVAILTPQSDVSLVESRQRKSRFLRQAVIELSLSNVSIAAQRVEQWRPGYPVDCIVCRGYGTLRKFFDDTRALHHPGCRLVAMKGAAPASEIADLGVNSSAVAVQALDVPGWDHRHIVTIDCAE